MKMDDFIEVDYYEEGKWITRRLPLEVAVNLYQQLGQALGARGHAQQEMVAGDRLKVFVD